MRAQGTLKLYDDRNARADEAKRFMTAFIFSSSIYMGAIVAARFNPVIRAFYQRLQRVGKAKEGGAHRLHAEVADDSQCDAETSDSLAADGGASYLNPKTVADTTFFLMIAGDHSPQ